MGFYGFFSQLIHAPFSPKNMALVFQKLKSIIFSVPILWKYIDELINEYS